MKQLSLAVLIVLGAAIPAAAQFPPPGVYLCVDMNGAAFGSLALSPAGEYQFNSAEGIGGAGQLASSGSSVNAVSGPLADLDLSGSFTMDARGATFIFTTLQGSVLCAPPAP